MEKKGNTTQFGRVARALFLGPLSKDANGWVEVGRSGVSMHKLCARHRCPERVRKNCAFSGVVPGSEWHSHNRRPIQRSVFKTEERDIKRYMLFKSTMLTVKPSMGRVC